MGFLLLGLIAGTDHSFELMFFYFLVYMFSTATVNYVLFDSYILSIRTDRRIVARPLMFLPDLSGLKSKISSSIPVWVLTLILFSMIGVPPLAGFFSKYLLLLQMFEQGHGFLLFNGLATSLISAYYYLRLIKTIWFEQPVFVAKTFLLFVPNVFMDKFMSTDSIFFIIGVMFVFMPFFICKIF